MLPQAIAGLASAKGQRQGPEAQGPEAQGPEAQGPVKTPRIFQTFVNLGLDTQIPGITFGA